MAEAAETLNRQRQKTGRTIDLRNPVVQEGVQNLPRWRDHTLLAIRQRRDLRDLLPRGKSAHNVSFATAELRTPSGNLERITVAIKPFDKPRKALADAVANGWVLERGFNTTDPICVILDEQGSYVVTPAKRGVQSLDTEPWHQFMSTSDSTIEDHFRHRLSQVGSLLANLNFRGIDQADSQLRNYWITPTGDIEPIDWESTTIVDDPPTSDQLLSISISTLRPLFGNMTISNGSPAIFRGPVETRWRLFEEYVVGPYRKTMDNLVVASGLLDNNENLLEAVTSIRDKLRSRLGLG